MFDRLLGSIPTIVRTYKAAVTRRIQSELNGANIWQRNYHEHIIRNEASLDRIRLYIMNNPASWMLDRENPEAESYGRQEGQW